jgi:hypothetical protein
MSKILDRLKDSGDSNGRCHVRVSDNMTYGPVALATVCQWAAQGRVTAESEISFDRKEWVRADSIPELGLEWMASSDGADDFGPFNLTALSALVRRGLISPDARLKHRETDETLDVPQALARAAASRPLDAAASRLLQTMQATVPGGGQSVDSHSGACETDGTTAAAPAESDALVSELRQELAAAQGEGGRLAERLRVEQGGWDSLKGELSRAQELLAETRARQETLQAESDAREIEQGGRIAELEELLNVAQEGRAAADAERESARESASTHIEHGEQKALELEQLRGRVEALENAVAAAHERVVELGAERDKLKADTTELASLTAQLAETREAGAQHELEQGLEGDKRREQVNGLTERLSAAEAHLKAERGDAGTLKSECEVARQEVSAQAKQIRSLDRKLKNRDKKVAQFKLDLKQRDKTIKSLSKDAPKAAARVVELEAAAAAGAAEVETMRAESESLAAAHSEHTAKVTEHVELTSKAEAEKKALESRGAELEEALAGRDDVEAELKKALADKSSALEDAEKAVAEKDQALGGAKTALTAAVTATDDLLAEYGKLETEQEADRTAAGKLREELKQAESDAAKLKVELGEARAEAAKPAPEPAPSKEWYLRYDDANMLGPVSCEVLVQWAKDCRVAHDHDVSSDKIFWAKAADVPELAMEWMVMLIDGTDYGPINKHAIHDLIADEAVAKDAELTHGKTGEKLKAQDVKPC